MEEEQTQVSIPDVANDDYEAVAAAMEAGKYNTPAVQTAAEGDTPPPSAEPPTNEGVKPQGQTPPPQEQPEDWKRKYDSVAGNNRTLAEQNRQMREQMQAIQAQQAQMEAQFKRQLEDTQALADIRATVPPEFQEQAIAEYKQKREQGDLQQAANEYRNFLQSQADVLLQERVKLFQQSLPSEMPGLVNFLAERFQAPADTMLPVVQTPAFNEVYTLIESQHDLDLVAQVLAAVGQASRKQELATREQNRQNFIAAGTGSSSRTVVQGPQGASAPSLVDRIKGMTDKQFDEYEQRVMRSRSLNV